MAPSLSRHNLLRIQSAVQIRRWRRRGVEIGQGVRFYGNPTLSLEEDSHIRIGDRCLLMSDPRLATLGTDHPVVIRTVHSGAVIELGEDVGITGGAVVAARGIVIGEGTMLGANAMIVDTDFHPLDSLARRFQPLPVPQAGDEVRIGKNVFVGSRAVVLKGSTVGDNSVIAAGAVVSGEIPAGVIAAGVPAKPLRALKLS